MAAVSRLVEGKREKKTDRYLFLVQRYSVKEGICGLLAPGDLA